MIGIKLKISNHKVSNLKLLNNNNNIINFSYKNFEVYIVGQIFEDESKIKKIIIKALEKKKYNTILKFNGEYALVIINKKNNFFIVANSQNSYLPVFYVNSKKNLLVDYNILNFNKKYFSKINFIKIYEWLLFNGRSFNEETFLKDIKILEPGSLILKNNKNFKKICLPPFVYKPDKINLSEATKKIINSLQESVNKRIEKSSGIVQFGLSGGLDSRILASLIKKKNLSKVISHTISSKFSFEKKISRKVAKALKLKHYEVDVPIKEYYLSAFEGMKYGGINNIFKHGVYRKFLQKKFKKKEKNIMFGNALDVLIASSYSSRDLMHFHNKDEYKVWFKKKYLLFSIDELKLLFNCDFKDAKLFGNFNKFVNKYNFLDSNVVDINDAFTFETRIKRWHNYTLNSFSEFTNFLIPTYDQNFLKICSTLPHKFRLSDILRKNILKNVNIKLLNLKTSNFLEKLYLRRKKNYKSLYDVNLGFDIKKNKNIFYLLDIIEAKLYKLKKISFINFSHIKKIISEHRTSENDNTRKILLIISLLISMIYIFEKQNFNYEKN